MPKKCAINLEIDLADWSKSAGQIAELYGSQIRDDIDMLAWNFYDCSDQKQAENFSNLVIEGYKIGKKPNGDFRIEANFSVECSDTVQVNKIFEEYMDGFEDYISDAENGLYSRTGKRTRLNWHPIGWNLEVK